MYTSERNKSQIERYGQWIVGHPRLVIALTAILIITAAYGTRFLNFATDYRVFFSPDNPQLQAFDELQNVYTKNDNILFVVEPADNDPFSPQSIRVVAELVDAGWKLPYAIRVDGVTNFQHTEADGDELVVADLVEDPGSVTAGELSKARRIALQEPLLADRLVSGDGRIVGVNVTVQLPGEAINEVPTTADAASALAKRLESRYPGTNIYVTGVVMINNAFVTSGQRDLMTVFPLMFALIILFMIVLLRSFWGTASTITVIGMSAAAAVGLAGWFGHHLTPTSAQAPTMIMTLAVADSVHLLVTMLQEMRRGKKKPEAIVESFRINFVPVFLTSLTTVIGFLSLNFSDSPPYRHLGNITALGVAFAFVLSVTFFPAVLSVLPMRERKIEKRTSNFFGRLAEWVIARRRWVLGGSMAVVLLAVWLAPGNKLNDEFVKYFDTSIEFRTDTDFANDNLTGLTTIEHSIGSGSEGGISEPAYLALLDSLGNWYEQQPGVQHVNHLGLIMKRLNMNMHGGDSSYYRIPNNRELAAQYLLLFEMSLPYGLDLNNMISVDKSSTRFTVTGTDIPSSDLIRLAQRGEKWLENHAPETMHAVASSPALMFSYLSRRQVMSMISGSILALILITASMIFAFRSVRYGLLSLIPNLIPMILGFGAWALLAAEIGLAHSTIVGMTLGIVVDDTVHFLNKYLRARREHGLSAEESVRYAFNTVGRALLVTSVVLIAGFLVLSASSFKLNASLGQLSAITIGFALIADFLFLPALLLAVDRKKEIYLTRTASAIGEVAPVMITEQQFKGDVVMKNTKSINKGLLVVLMLVTLAAGANATPEERGRQIAEEVDRRDSGFVDNTAELKMILRNSHGQESVRNIRTRTLEILEDGDKSLVIFDHPPDVKGTSFLSYTHVNAPDDQWLYLPALKRVKRIASKNKSGPFVGSEFAYEDLSSQEVDKYAYKYLYDDVLEGQDCFVVERYPVDENSGYTRQVVWVDKEEYRPQKLEYYDRKGDLLKTLTFHQYQQYQDRYWRADRWEMVNHQTGKSTTLLWTNFSFKTGLSERDFNQNVLKSIR